jgi:hypothetical protein
MLNADGPPGDTRFVEILAPRIAEGPNGPFGFGKIRHSLGHDLVTVLPPEPSGEQLVSLFNIGNIAAGKPPESAWKSVSELRAAMAQLDPLTTSLLIVTARVIDAILDGGSI